MGFAESNTLSHQTEAPDSNKTKAQKHCACRRPRQKINPTLMASSIPKTSWADDVDELEHPKSEEFVDEDGVRTVIEYSVNDEGKKVKITRRIKRTLQKSIVEHNVAERQKWAKFGAEKGKKAGPDRATTTVGENVALKLSAGNKTGEAEPAPEENVKVQLARAGAGKVVCRLCQGEHFTAKCPYKDTLAGLDNTDAGAAGDEDTHGKGPTALPSSLGASAGGKYVPPSMRGPGGTRTAGTGVGGAGNRDDLPTLRVTNISEDTQENDLRDLFGIFGRVARVYVGRDRETGAGKGFAFVSFEDRAAAQKAIDKVHGKGYDSLILSVQWSQPRPEQR
ncbi:eukaryotic translation initiation factor 3 subunit G-domain-containing protein [Lyophyllum atratum]|nr:eukaryotic translation initiation factor 3 subunit G-domain-containing protein [Lyophyllum atratum]